MEIVNVSVLKVEFHEKEWEMIEMIAQKLSMEPDEFLHSLKEGLDGDKFDRFTALGDLRRMSLVLSYINLPSNLSVDDLKFLFDYADDLFDSAGAFLEVYHGLYCVLKETEFDRGLDKAGMDKFLEDGFDLSEIFELTHDELVEGLSLIDQEQEEIGDSSHGDDEYAEHLATGFTEITDRFKSVLDRFALPPIDAEEDKDYEN